MIIQICILLAFQSTSLAQNQKIKIHYQLGSNEQNTYFFIAFIENGEPKCRVESDAAWVKIHASCDTLKGETGFACKETKAHLMAGDTVRSFVRSLELWKIGEENRYDKQLYEACVKLAQIGDSSDCEKKILEFMQSVGETLGGERRVTGQHTLALIALVSLLLALTLLSALAVVVNRSRRARETMSRMKTEQNIYL